VPSREDEPLEYWVDAGTFGFEDDLERRGMSRAELAREYGSSTAFISKVLNGSTNYTLKTMARLGRAVGGVLQVRLVHEDDEVLRVLSLEEAELLDSRREARRAAPPNSGTAGARE
jgi:transcriptional regulator with XRE-family HTH domain